MTWRRLVAEIDRQIRSATAPMEERMSTIESQIGVNTRVINTHDKKLGIINENALRHWVASRRGRKYSMRIKFTSIRDVVRYIEDMLGYPNKWSNPAEAAVIDLMLKEVSLNSLKCT
jgi:hypothetical protein